MRNQYRFRKLNIIIIVLAVVSAFSIQANANAKIDRYKMVVVQKLTEKLRVDLADQTVQVKINDVRSSSEISKNLIDFDGNALAVVKDDKTELPFQFTAKVNINSRDVETLDYKFVEAEFAPSAVESSLMKNLMTQISKDYKTTNIVIAIDGFERAQGTSGEAVYEGSAEVRIGDLEWRKIRFNVALDSQNQAAKKILYNIEKE